MRADEVLGDGSVVAGSMREGPAYSCGGWSKGVEEDGYLIARFHGLYLVEPPAAVGISREARFQEQVGGYAREDASRSVSVELCLASWIWWDGPMLVIIMSPA